MTENQSPMPKMTPEENVRPERKIGCLTYCCVIGFVLIVLIWFNILRGVPLRITPETTHITEPLTPDKRFVDYLAAFEQHYYPPETATDDNGYRMVFRAVGGPLETSMPEYVQGYYEKLGLDYILDKPTLSYTEPHDYFERRYKAQPEDFDDILAYMTKLREREPSDLSDDEDATNHRFAGRTPEEDIQANSWRTWEFTAMYPDMHKLPMVQEWLTANNEALDLVVEASHKPVFIVPIVVPSDAACMYEVLLPGLQGVRSFARGLQARAAFRVSEGDIDGAIEDILACYRLGRHLSRPSFMVQQLVGIACEGIAHSVAFNGNLTTQADAKQLKHFQEGLNNLPPRGTWQDGIEMERLAYLDSLTAIMKDPTVLSRMGFGSSVTDNLLLIVGLDWNVIFKRANSVFDEMVAGTFDDTRSVPNPAHLLTLKARSELAAEIFIAWTLPATEVYREAFHRTECCDNLKRIQLAMFLYHAEHGTLPPAFSVDADGKPLHSWRTLLLPYFGDAELAELYAQIRLDEPWDSEHNLPFHQRNLDVYRCPSNPTLAAGETSYSVIVGDELLFTGDGQGQTLAGHGRNMLMVVERKDDTVCWMQPDAEISHADAESGISSSRRSRGLPIHGGPITFSSVATTTTISSNHTGGCNFALRDGSIEFISEVFDLERFRELINGTAKERP